MHTLHCYFKPTTVVVVKRQDKRLPDPNGPLSSIIPAEESKRPRGLYLKLTPVQQAQIAKYALANGNKAAILRYTNEFQTVIKMSSISTWKAKCVSEMKRLRKSSGGSASRRGYVAVQSLPRLKRGRPLLLGEDLDCQVKSYIRQFVRSKESLIVLLQ